ncbi:MAG TPA: cytochrome P450 [Streptosporangiaceae bacterium]|nr:cytochrome P450 [Streptosporangiaceae bacterium]
MAVGATPLHPDFATIPPAERHRFFAGLRAADSPAFLPYTATEGFYALVRYEEIAQASRAPKSFSSEPSALSLDDVPAALAGTTPSMLNLDDPRHARLRRVVSRAFTPRMIKKCEDDVAVIARRIVDRLIEKGPCDFVTDVAMPMPLEIICSLMGIPEEFLPGVVEATNLIMAITDSDGRIDTAVLAEQVGYFGMLMADLAEQRRKEPADDLITALVNANIDGESLTETELGSFFRLLTVAGNETTRNAISHALALLTEYPSQRALLLEDLDTRLPGAVEEVLRYASPVSWMRRNVVGDVELCGHTYREGDRVLFFYASANRDENVFDRPDDFDITRSPNPHVAFGGPGPHFCLGAHLARREISLLLRELLTRVPGVHATADPLYRRSSFINGIDHLACSPV